VIVPAAVLAKQYRGRGHDQRVDAFLSRWQSIKVLDTDRAVDATVAAAGLASGGAVVLTSDPDDLGRISDGIPGIEIVKI
jgi:hypothetical protein